MFYSFDPQNRKKTVCLYKMKRFGQLLSIEFILKCCTATFKAAEAESTFFLKINLHKCASHISCKTHCPW